MLILLFVPSHHASVSSVATTTVNNTGFFGGHTHGAGFFLYVLPLSVILTQYTITGYDASAHLSEETHSAADGAAKGIWRSIFYSAIGGWILLLSFLFAVQDEAGGVTAAGGAVDSIFGQALGKNWHVLVLAISTAGQFFCTVACMTSTTRMLFAFSRDGAVPGHKYWSKLNKNRVPVYGVIAAAVVAVILTSPRWSRSTSAARRCRSPSSRSSRSASSGCTSPSRSRSTCAGGPATASRRAAGRSGRSTSGCASSPSPRSRSRRSSRCCRRPRRCRGTTASR